MRIIPNKDRVVLRLLEDDEETTKSGLVLLRLNKHETAYKGIIEVTSDPKEWAEGDTVLFPPFAGDAVRVEENGKWREKRIIRFDSILAKIC